MAYRNVLLEIEETTVDAFAAFDAALRSVSENEQQIYDLLRPHTTVSTSGPVSVSQHHLSSMPIPMFTTQRESEHTFSELAAFASTAPNPDLTSVSSVVPAEIEESEITRLSALPGITVWPDPQLTLFAQESNEALCPPFGDGAPILEVQALLNVEPVWADGFDGTGIIIGVLDQGIDGSTYPVSGGMENALGPQPGESSVLTHGSMCAADVLVGAPRATLYDYPFLGHPRSGGALAMFNTALEQRRLNGTPHVLTNSYGFTSLPDRDDQPRSPSWDLGHPLNRKIREVVASGASVFFAAGNCGNPCPSQDCDESGIGPSRSIHGPNSLEEVITISAVDRTRSRIGYSSQGPGLLFERKPDLASFSHLCANFGEGRPGGTLHPFDSGTSAACPVAAGVAALLVQAAPHLSPDVIKACMIAGAVPVGEQEWSPDLGHGVVDAAGAYTAVQPYL